MKHNRRTFREQFEKMPIYGKMRKLDRRLTFGQYLTVLKEWWDKTKEEDEGFETELRELLKVNPHEMHPYVECVSYGKDDMRYFIRIKEILDE